jgi:hypothetical protein
VWKQKLVQMGGRVQEEKAAKGATFNHVLAADAKALLRELDAAWLHRFRGVMATLYDPLLLLSDLLLLVLTLSLLCPISPFGTLAKVMWGITLLVWKAF